MGCGILEEQNNTLGIKEDSTGSASDAPRMQLWVSLMHKWGRRGCSLLWGEAANTQQGRSV